MWERSLPPRTAEQRRDFEIPTPTASAELRKKTIDQKVCGWIGGLAEIPALCSGDSSCVRDTEHKYVGCCENSGSCTAGIYTSCIDRNSVGWAPPGSIQYNGVYTCAGNNECYRNTYADGYFQYGCGLSSWATHVETTYSGQPTDVALQIVYSAVTFSPMSSELASSKPAILISDNDTFPSATSPAQTSLIASPTLSINPSVTTSSASSFIPLAKPLRPGVIAGIIIGVVNGLAILAIIAFWLCRRRRIQRLNISAPQMSSKSEAEVMSRQSGPLDRIPPLSPLTARIPSPPNPNNNPAPDISTIDPILDYPGSVQNCTSPQRTFFITANDTDDFTCGFDDVDAQNYADGEDEADNDAQPELPEIGIAISSDRQSLLRPDQQSSSRDGTEHSSVGKGSSLRRPRSRATESDEDSMVSPVTDEDEISPASSIRPAALAWRGNEARYQLVDQVIKEET